MESKYSFGFGFTLDIILESCLEFLPSVMKIMTAQVVSVKARCSTLPRFSSGLQEKEDGMRETGSTGPPLPYLPGLHAHALNYLCPHSEFLSSPQKL